MERVSPSGDLSRRDLFKGAAAAGLGALPASAAGRSNAIVAENQKPGTTDWQLTYTKVDPKTKWRSPLIEGYVSRASVRAGQDLDVMVSTNPAGPFTLDIYRLGYYGGTGGRHMMQLGPFEGTVQPDPPEGEERLRECSRGADGGIRVHLLWFATAAETRKTM